MFKKIVVALLFVFFSSLAFAQDLDWTSLIPKAIAKGETSEANGSIFKTVKDIELPKAEYLSVVGGFSDGVFEAWHLEIASEHWIRNEDGNWDIDQWLFAVTLEGKSYFTLHNRMIQTDSGSILFYDSIAIGEGEESTKLAEIHELWKNNLGLH